MPLTASGSSLVTVRGQQGRVLLHGCTAAAGTYELETGVWADEGTNGSFWVKVNGVNHGRWDTALNVVYQDDMVGVSTADPLVLNLPAGNHSVEVLLREDGTRLDWVALVPASGS